MNDEPKILIGVDGNIKQELLEAIEYIRDNIEIYMAIYELKKREGIKNDKSIKD